MSAATTTNFIGTFVWHDLMTNDIPKAKAFYTALLPEWSLSTISSAGMPYEMIEASGTPIGGMVDTTNYPGVPPHWIPYVAVENLAATLARVEEHGGKVCVPAFSVPGVGSFAVIEDPTGGYIKPFELAYESNLPAMPLAGQFCWNELMSLDVEKAKAFYAAIFGWTAGPSPFPNMDYTIFSLGERMIAGAMKMPHPGIPRSFWQSYLIVPDVDARTAKAIELGATLCVPEPIDIEGIGRRTFLVDPTGAAFALHTFAPMA